MYVSLDITVKDGSGDTVICAVLTSDDCKITVPNKAILGVEHVLTLRQALQGVVGASDSWMEIELDLLGILEQTVNYYSIT